jgi:type I restriction enzyme S subunit
MNKWSNVVIDDCCDILDHLRVPVNGQDRQNLIGDVPYYGANGLQGYINDFIFNEDLILIAEDGGNFEEHDTRPIAYKITGKSWVNNHAHILKAKNGYSQDYIFYSLVHKNIVRFIAGGTRSKLNKSELVKIPIYCPDNPVEQGKIAKILSTTDTVIDKTQAAIAKYKAIKRGMLNDLFTRGIDIKTGKIRPKQQDAPELYKESELGWIPNEWEIKKVEELIECPIRDFGSFSMTNLITFLEHGVLFIKTEAIQDGYIDYNKVSYISKDVHQLLHKSIVNKGDVLFTKIGAIGRVAIYDSNEIANSNAASAKIKFNDENNKYYLAFKLNSNRVMREFEKTIISTPPRINLGDINKMKIEIPQKKEQDKIASIIKNINNQIISEQSFLNKQLNLKSGLMADLLSGNKIVTA